MLYDGGADLYKEYGDKVHHNIFINHSESAVTLWQDYIQFYNNILDGDELGISMYNQYNRLRVSAYNNTLLSAGIQSSSRNDRAFAPWDYVYNNVLDNTPAGMSYENRPLAWWPYTDDQVCSNINTSNLHVNYNYLYRPQSSSNQVVMSGQTSCDGTQTLYGGMTLAQFNQSYSVNNYTKPSSEETDKLFSGTSGAEKYVTRASHTISGFTTIANSGIGGPHPYLDGVTLPSYVGATNPNDNAWVAGVLGLANVSNLQNSGAGDPDWIERTVPPPMDTNAPTVTNFVIPPTASSLAVEVTIFTAIDTVGVIGYMLTESAAVPSSGDANWTASAPLNYTFPTAGSKTLYAWAKDAAGNVSTNLNDSVEITIDTTPPAVPLGLSVQ